MQGANYKVLLTAPARIWVSANSLRLLLDCKRRCKILCENGASRVPIKFLYKSPVNDVVTHLFPSDRSQHMPVIVWESSFSSQMFCAGQWEATELLNKTTIEAKLRYHANANK